MRHAICLVSCSRMHQLGMLKTTVQLVLEYKVGKYVFGRENAPSTTIVLNMDSNHSKIYCTCVRHAICLVSCSRMHQLGVLKTTVQLVCEFKDGKYVFCRQNTPSTYTVLNMDSNHSILYMRASGDLSCFLF